MSCYKINKKLWVPGMANPRYADLSLTEIKRGYRVIGGDKGDIHFYGYIRHVEFQRTILVDPELHTTLWDNLDPPTDYEVFEVAEDILINAYNSIGVECVEHS